MLEVGHQKIALRIDVGRSVVGDLSGVMADAESVVEHGRAEPDRQAVIASVERLPEAHVVAGPRAFAVGLLEGQILLAVLVEEGTDRRVQVGPIEQHAADDPHARTQRDRVGGSPPSRVHGAEHVILGALESNINRIAW